MFQGATSVPSGDDGDILKIAIQLAIGIVTLVKIFINKKKIKDVDNTVGK